MYRPGSLHGFLHGKNAAHAAGDLPDGTVWRAAEGRELVLFITLTGFTAATLRPVFRLKNEDGPVQYPDASQDVALTAEGSFCRRVIVPRGVEVALRLESVTGAGTVQVRGLFQDQ